VGIKAYAGWVISEISEDNYGNKQYQTTFIQNSLIRFETESSVAIINLRTAEITLVFGYYKLYWQGTISQFKKSTVEVFEQKLKNIVATADPEQKEIARDLIVKIKKDYEEENSDTINSPFKINIIYKNKQEVIAGFKSKKYEISTSDSLLETIWITDSINPYKDINIESMISFTNQLKPSQSKNSIEGSDEYLNLIRNGLAMKSTKKNPYGGSTTTVVSSVIETKINPDIFLPPETYRKAELMEIMLLNDNNTQTNKLKEEFNRAKSNPLYD
jgi:hypothetical protein